MSSRRFTSIAFSTSLNESANRCMYMFPPLALGGCRLVRGLINGSATCDKFTPRR
jgi:hypothetical protein